MKKLILFLNLFLLVSTGLVSSQERTAVANSSIADVRRYPSSSSELVTQVLFNEKVIILETDKGWARVLVPGQYRTAKGYPGWIKTPQLTPISQYHIDGGQWVLISSPHTRFYKSLKTPDDYKEIYFGTYLRYMGFVEDKNKKWYDKPVYWLKARSASGETGWVFYGHSNITHETPCAQATRGVDVAHKSKNFLKTSYLWGGMTVRGIDCSGLAYMVYRYFGYYIPRDADQQFEFGKPITMSNLSLGDLVFYGRGSSPTHVGIYVGNGWVVHASRSGGVVQESFHSSGLFDRYLGARRIMD
ncbi:MAG: NlpC/P60 family protein [Vulcanimicrobiota bacterium]